MSNTTLPEMSQHEASWHEHLAGMRAKEAARKQGANPVAIDAFAMATAGPQTIAGFTLYPASEGTIWTLKRVAREFAVWADAWDMPAADFSGEVGHRELLELGLSTLVFCDALQVWMDLQTGCLESLIVRAEQIMFNLPRDRQKQLEHHFQQQMATIGDLVPDREATPGKSQRMDGNGTSPVTPIPAVEADSPTSNGSPPNMESVSTMPSGGPQS